ncbi:MAG TPA: hypothetical protein PLO05_01335 [Bacteroidales bacterium]|jgi:hypothetical protein|nr:hypothetical protein [Bacteroidales bacterium]MDD4236281.1 hypothetical protein [Bacteroidales bacterium]MDY0160811.1 hypothetical protein [Bacteroidales bacterium]HRW20753.1 hypothetical protein [Bacteroidales bacterium]HXK80783.1 hypothetical protein [Bacteroidales bacterium]
MSTSKMRVIKDFEKLDPAIREQIKLVYPNGFSQHLIHFTDKEGRIVSALPFETDDKYYMVRMTSSEAKEIIRQDDDYDDDGTLKDDMREEYEDKYGDLDYLAENIPDDDLPTDDEDDN